MRASQVIACAMMGAALNQGLYFASIWPALELGPFERVAVILCIGGIALCADRLVQISQDTKRGGKSEGPS